MTHFRGTPLHRMRISPSRLFALFGLCATVTIVTAAPAAPDPVTATYQIQQTVTLSGIPAGARTVKWWVAIPEDDRNQEVLDFNAVSSPGKWSIVRDSSRGNRFLYIEVDSPPPGSLTAKVDFLLRRRSTFVTIDPAQVGALTDVQRRIFAEELRRDAPHMEATPALVELANKVCGTESNIATQARLLLNAVADVADHYSQDPTKPKYSVGDASSCLARAGGTCTDMHSLFIALARSRDIPARLQMGYRLMPANEGKVVDPGYRCWVEYFVPGYGWIPADIVEADNPKGLGRDRWFTGLNERRLWLNEGREFDFGDRSVISHPINLMVVGYAEIDGVEARVLPDGDKPAQVTRTVQYHEIKPTAPSAPPAPAKT